MSSDEAFKQAFDQRPKGAARTARNARLSLLSLARPVANTVLDDQTHALSVFGDGMKSRANCLTVGESNLYCLTYSTSAPGTDGRDTRTMVQLRIGRCAAAACE